MPNLSGLTTRFFPTPNEGFTTTTSGSIDSSVATTIGLNSVSGLTDGSVFTGLLDPGNAKERAFTGLVDTGGSQITNVVFTTGSNATHTAGATVVDYVTSTHIAQMTKGILIAHDQDGTLKAGAVDNTAALADAIVTNAKLSTTAGEVGGAWTDWTPTFTNLSGGTLNYARYTRIGKTIHYKIMYTLGGAGVAGAVTFTYPVTIRDGDVNAVNGKVHLVDTGSAAYLGHVLGSSTTVGTIRVDKVDGTYNVSSGISSTIPFTWANTDIIFVEGTIEAA